MSLRETKITTTLRSTALAVALGFGLAVSGPVAAQVSPTAEDEPVTAAPATEEDEGFDDWGLLGLLGLAGLAGLRKREPEVRTVESTTTPRV